MSEWIDINKVSPESTALLLFYGGIIASGSKRVGRLGEPQQDEMVYRCDCCGRYSNPTHWMPLPTPPET